MTILRRKCKSRALKTFINFGCYSTSCSLSLGNDQGPHNYLFGNNEERDNTIFNNMKVEFVEYVLRAAL